MDLNTVVTLLAVVGSALTVYFNLKKFGDNIRQETEWRTTINHTMEDLLSKVTELLQAHKGNSQLIRELLESRIHMEHKFDVLEPKIDKAWCEIDRIRNDVADIREKIKQC